MIREIEVSSDWFGCVLVISFHVVKVFSESVACRFCFTNAYFFAINTSYAANDIGGGVGKVIIDLNRSLGSGHFLYVVNERTSFAS